ncbi:tRNA (adenosine(37)-N6)-dimethylallyltransferase MiaA [Pseudoclavibacter chungangensis]|uniref:tRNA dimethylallyltransferase n=1 Tax=Pseudoclavibacter chungangensis TaxID=587635 RepID=A0A7J5BPW9_9MICO|nr:tRNA (adenosine(37)-N6)-dimethylallyltransferase MiaA [Pseudoclavibacter chungangensis]KAB1653102.1 tRNA (adenosine(37)-N6)-dimethylallyltransferase MiaA [Pseudoclavibacter chungangensis]NYJ67010.1 tRNA dimethylallyltransferase [Pseudoclavibacter chungangensis]
MLVVGGATGTGKSALALEIAGLLEASGTRAEVVNADAMQLYRGMDIGTAKLPPEDRRGVEHHLLDVLDVDEDASVAAYQRTARSTIESIERRGAVPVLVGGSGLYISAVCFDLRFPGTDDAVRARLEAELEQWGPGMLARRLAEYDPVAAEKIGPHNGRRIVRALEVIAITGRPFSATLPDHDSWWRPTTFVVLEQPREVLTPRLDARVVAMWDQGIVAETARLLESGLERGTTARRAIGYAQAIGELRGELTRDEAIAEAQALTRKYARRQVGWFRRYESAIRLDAGDPYAAGIVVDAAREAGTLLGATGP